MVQRLKFEKKFRSNRSFIEQLNNGALIFFITGVHLLH